MAKQEAVSMQMDGALEAKVEAYCEFHDIKRETLLKSAMAEFLKEHDPELDQLMNGYVEMAQLNAEICQEFSACESEAYSHIR
ncbi:hypothetical protein [Lacticaseibacillus saniviri]|uniref:CopG family transcriptional regulator n=1 Tax=Lacticaseibacillus saniviri JCM 17471 = DSM 24301 TaxID=1293598 RepID=A0A0R2MUT0_9LACO|nr:hypothetical protein [Lacticaseibacillus saniviri]KRO17255.1 hypothetical protein IV56_GL000375 [Lacticaseibacillus saniviri JCM 17471 = DSM 24301]MCG4281158.1 antitoxin [Lacticaseibacillus saniviri]